ncbi:MAG: efflux RND transporter periplasmic adaptor subunit [Burkholderiaceae bacterium]|nr:efflux RND transporter periplasmic adaptor subunit [Burkholderiaceae bacterium]
MTSLPPLPLASSRRRYLPRRPARFPATCLLTRITLALAGATLALGAGAATLGGCLIEPERIAEVGTPVAGVIERVEVERGERVRRGQVLAVLRAEDLFRQSFISQQALDQARTEARLAEQKLRQAREQRAISRQERDVAEAQLAQRVIRSPMDGVVVERHASAGERADDRPLLRIARIDPLRVQLVVPTALYGQLRLGSPVAVQPELPGAARMAARVTAIDKVIDPASNTFRVQAALPNPDLALPAGLRCKAELDAATLAAAPPPPASPRR